MVWGITQTMVSPLDWLATVSQPIIACLLGIVAWYLKRGYETMKEMKADNRFFHKAIKGDDKLGYPGLMQRQNNMKGRMNTVIRNQRHIHESLQDYGVVDEPITTPDTVNGPDPTIEDLD